jgi:hypothetical protein
MNRATRYLRVVLASVVVASISGCAGYEVVLFLNEAEEDQAPRWCAAGNVCIHE